MYRLSNRLAAAVFAATAATVPLVANAADGVTVAGQDVVPMLVWMFVGVGIAAILLGTLYLFKRRIGAFPRHPSWVAPITIMRSADLPGDRDPHEATSGDQEPHIGDNHAAAH